MNIQPKRLSILFTTDEHGAIRNAPAVQQAIDEMRLEEPGRSLVVSGGDVFQGAPESEMDHGQPALQLIPKAGYDLVTLGNHDFDYGQGFLQEWTNHATYPILSANVRDAQGQLLPGVQASIVKQMDGFKVGFIGITTQTTPDICLKANVQGLQFQDPVPAVRQEIQRLKDQGVDLIGLVAHTEEREEERVAAEVPGIDFILAGHTHQVYDQPKDAHGVPVYRSGSSREAVGKLTIELDPSSGRPVSQNWEILPCSASQRHEGPVQQLVDQQMQRYHEEMDVPLSFSETAISTNYLAEGDDVDRMMARAIAREAGAEIGFHNQKTVRSSVSDGFLTRGDAQRVFPFPNRVQRIEVSKRELLEVVRLSEQRNDHTSLFFHGMSIDRDRDGTAVNLRDDQGMILPKTFSVGTLDFIAGGALGYFNTPKTGPVFHQLPSVLANAVDDRQWETLGRNESFGFRDGTDYAL